MPRYRIDCGNSATGPVGFVAVVNAANKRAALDQLKEVLPGYAVVLDSRPSESVEYLTVYFNGDGIKPTDISEDEE